MQTFKLSIARGWVFGFCILILATPVFLRAQAVSINTDGSNPDPSAILDVKSTAKGMLVPRMTSAQRTVIAAPATGLLVFDTTTGGFWFYNGAGWINLSVQKQLADADGDTKIQVEESPDEDVVRVDLGSIERVVIRKNNATGNNTMLELPNSNESIFIGKDAGRSNTSGTGNTFLGNQAGNDNTTGFRNTFLGRRAGYHNLDGGLNTFLGQDAGFSNTTGNWNTFVGDAAGSFNTSGFANTFLGNFSGAKNVSGRWNTFLGQEAGTENQTGNANVAIGQGALYKNTDRSNLVAVGDSALYNNGTGTVYTFEATSNTAVGSKALYSNTSGNSNTAHGYRALFSNITGFDNTANGVAALYSNTTGYANTAIGAGAGSSNTTGNNNTYIGSINNAVTETGSNNTAVGGWDGAYAYDPAPPFGLNNTFLGANTGNLSVYGNKLTLIGASANLPDLQVTIETATAIGYNARVNCSHCLVLGGTGPDSVDVGIGLHTPVSDLHIVQKNGSAGLNKLGVRLQDRDGTFWNTYVDYADDYNFAHNGALTAYIQDGTGTYVAISDARLKTGIEPLGPVLEGVVKLQPKWYHRTGYEGRPKTLGFIAQEVESVFPQLVFEKGGVKGLDYDYFGVMAIKAIQEQQAEMETLKAENAALKAQLDTQAAQLQKIAVALQAAGIGVEH